MAECMFKLLDKKGTIVIEVQYLLNTLKDLRFDNLIFLNNISNTSSSASSMSEGFQGRIYYWKFPFWIWGGVNKLPCMEYSST